MLYFCSSLDKQIFPLDFRLLLKIKHLQLAGVKSCYVQRITSQTALANLFAVLYLRLLRHLCRLLKICFIRSHLRL